VDSCFTSHAFFYALFQHNINACGIFHYDWHGVPWDTWPNLWKSKGGTLWHMLDRTKGLFAGKTVWCVCSHKMYAPTDECSFTDESGHLVRSCVTEDYKACVGFVDKSDRIVNTVGISQEHEAGLRNSSAPYNHSHPHCIP